MNEKQVKNIMSDNGFTLHTIPEWDQWERGLNQSKQVFYRQFSACEYNFKHQLKEFVRYTNKFYRLTKMSNGILVSLYAHN